MDDEEMLKKWLAGKEQKAFENGVEYAKKKIFDACGASSMPIALSLGDDAFYVSIDEIGQIIANVTGA